MRPERRRSVRRSARPHACGLAARLVARFIGAACLVACAPPVAQQPESTFTLTADDDPFLVGTAEHVETCALPERIGTARSPADVRLFLSRFDVVAARRGDEDAPRGSSVLLVTAERSPTPWLTEVRGERDVAFSLGPNADQPQALASAPSSSDIVAACAFPADAVYVRVASFLVHYAEAARLVERGDEVRLDGMLFENAVWSVGAAEACFGHRRVSADETGTPAFADAVNGCVPRDEFDRGVE